MKKKLVLILISVLCFAPAGVFAQSSIRNREEMRLDLQIVRDDANFTTPNKILIVPIEKPTSYKLSIDPQTWYESLYYYTIENLGYSDIPFHYVIGYKGEVFEGNEGGEERAVSIDGISGNPIVIAYLSDGKVDNFDPRSISSLNNLVSQVANRNSIRNIELSGVTFVKDDQAQTVKMQKSDVFGRWQLGLEGIVNHVNANFNPIGKEYSAEILSVDITSEKVNPGDIVEAKIKIKNTGKFGMYESSDSEIFLTKKENSASKFFLNNSWASNTQINIFPENDGIVPNEEQEFTFQMQAPLYVGTVSEEFEIRTASGFTVKANSFNLTLDMNSSEKQIVEIQNTELGFLRVREEASSVANEVSRVSPGQRFFVLEDAQNGWIKIDLGGGQAGWVARWYLNYIN